MKRTRTLWPLVVGLALIATVSSRTATSQKLDIAVKDRANAYASLAASNQFVAMAWGVSAKEGATDIYVVVSRDGGRAFGTPTRVAGEARLAGEQPPRITLVPRTGRTPSIVVVWTANGSEGTRLLSSRSDDDGRSFSAPVLLPGSNAGGNRGWESIATTRTGDVVALWLDHRESSGGRRGAAPMNHAEHQHLAAGRPDGVARAQLSKLWFAKLGGVESPKALTGGVCYCCKTTIATDSSGAIYAAWRHVFDGNIRDIAFTRSSDNGRSFVPPLRVSDDNWVLDGCPENGPSMVVDEARRRIHIVWPTLVPGARPTSEPTLALFHAMSADGKQFTARQRIPTDGVPRHPQMIVGPTGELIVAWDEQGKGTRRVALARGSIDGNGVARFVKLPIGDSTRAEYPVLASVGDTTLVAWTSGSVGQTVLRVERLMN